MKHFARPQPDSENESTQKSNVATALCPECLRRGASWIADRDFSDWRVEAIAVGAMWVAVTVLEAAAVLVAVVTLGAMKAAVAIKVAAVKVAVATKVTVVAGGTKAVSSHSGKLSLRS